MFVDDDADTKSEVKPAKKKVSKKELSIKYYTTTLPSNGLLGYPSEIEYRDILVRDEKILSSATGKTFQSVINKVLKSLLKDESIFDQLTIYDRDYLLLWVWANNYSTTKDFEITCPVCSGSDNITVDITKMDIEELSEDYVTHYEYELKSGKVVKLSLLTTQDEAIAADYIKHNKDDILDNVIMALSIDIGKVMMLPKKLKWIEDNINGYDMGMIRGFQEYFKYGIDDTVDHSCESCGEVTKHSIPFSFEFFMPTLRDNFEKMFRSNKRS